MGELIELFPGRAEPQSIRVEVKTPSRLKGVSFEDFVRELAEAQARALANTGERLRLSDDVLETLQKHVDPYRCELCGAPVYPKDGMWFNAHDGDLHNRVCGRERSA